MSAAKTMDFVTRSQNYQRQTGRKSMTPRQRRRAQQKLGRVFSRADRLTNAADALQAEEPKTRPCGGVEFCITKSGKKASKPHKGCA